MPLVFRLDWVQPQSCEQLRMTVPGSSADSSLAAACGSIPCFWHAGWMWAAVPSFACASLASPCLTGEALSDGGGEVGNWICFLMGV